MKVIWKEVEKFNIDLVSDCRGVDFTIVSLDIIANKLFKDHFRWNTISGYFVESMSIHPQDELEIKPSLF